MQTRKEIEKLIRKEKPVASLLYIKKNGIHYRAYLGAVPVFFKVPLNDLGDAEWLAAMPSQLLIRHLID